MTSLGTAYGYYRLLAETFSSEAQFPRADEALQRAKTEPEPKHLSYAQWKEPWQQ
jgi:hypothetical protein